MRIVLTMAMGLFLISCNNSSEKKADTKDTITEVKPIPDVPAKADTIFTGFGTEPFWSVYVINQTKIVFHPADGPDRELPFSVASNGPAKNVTYGSKSVSDTINITIQKRDCSDGMSDDIHPYQVTVTLNSKTYHGCGRDGK